MPVLAHVVRIFGAFLNFGSFDNPYAWGSLKGMGKLHIPIGMNSNPHHEPDALGPICCPIGGFVGPIPCPSGGLSWWILGGVIWVARDESYFPILNEELAKEPQNPQNSQGSQ